jgi:hypothetical protein
LSFLIEMFLRLIIKETESLFLLVLAECQGVRSSQLRLAAIELDELLLELLAGVLQLALVLGVILLQLLEFGVKLRRKKEVFGSNSD